jgi:hypothetical protein
MKQMVISVLLIMNSMFIYWTPENALFGVGRSGSSDEIKWYAQE